MGPIVIGHILLYSFTLLGVEANKHIELLNHLKVVILLCLHQMQQKRCYQSALSDHLYRR